MAVERSGKEQESTESTERLLPGANVDRGRREAGGNRGPLFSLLAPVRLTFCLGAWGPFLTSEAARAFTFTLVSNSRSRHGQLDVSRAGDWITESA
jgi:hypothetical protein